MVHFTLPPKLNISDYLKAIDSSGSGFVIIQENNRVTNIVTDGDMRRAIIAGKSVDDKYETLKKDCTRWSSQFRIKIIVKEIN